MKFQKPTKEQVLDAVKEGAVMAGTVCAGMVAVAVVKRILPKQEKKVGKAIVAVGSFVIGSMVEKQAESYIREELTEWTSAAKEAKQIIDLKDEDLGPNPDYALHANLVQLDSPELAAQLLDELNKVVDAKGFATLDDMVNLFDKEQVTIEADDETMNLYGWRDLSSGCGIQRNPDGTGTCILPRCVYFGEKDGE